MVEVDTANGFETEEAMSERTFVPLLCPWCKIKNAK